MTFQIATICVTLRSLFVPARMPLRKRPATTAFYTLWITWLQRSGSRRISIGTTLLLSTLLGILIALLNTASLESVNKPSHLDLTVLGNGNTAGVATLSLDTLKAPDLKMISTSPYNQIISNSHNLLAQQSSPSPG